MDNISEPVVSFVKCFRDNPKRFKIVKGDFAQEGMFSYEEISITDTKTGEVFNCSVQSDCRWRGFVFDDEKLTFLTQEEREYIRTEAVDWWISRVHDRHMRVLEWRNNKKRDKLKKVYCTEKNFKVEAPSPTKPLSSYEESEKKMRVDYLVSEKKKEIDKEIDEIKKEREKLEIQKQGYQNRPVKRYILLGLIVGFSLGILL